MGVSKFPNGILATPCIGAGTLADIWNSGAVYFVDGDNGSAGNVGLDPSSAVALPSTAVNMANSVGARGASVYIRPRSTAASAQTYYVDNIVIPLSLPGLSVIGAGSNPIRPYLGVDIKSNNVDNPVVNVKAVGVLLQGMRLAGTGQTAATTSYIVKAVADSANGLYASGLAIRYCQFGNARAGGAVYLNSPASVAIEGCLFHECLVGISTVQSYASYADWGLYVVDCDFGGRTTVRSMDIYLSQGGIGNSVVGSTNNGIIRCNFHDGLPANTAITGPRFISIINADMGEIIDCRFPVDPGANHITTFGVAGSQCIIPATWGVMGCRGTSDLDFIHPLAA